jgi:Predicted membrane protein
MVNLIPLKQLTQKGLNMKTLNVMLTAAALILTAGIAQADVRPDHIPGLLKSGEISSFEKLNQAALDKHPGATIVDTELDHSYGKLVYEVELRDSKGIKWDVDLDAKTAEVLQDKQDT